MVTRLKTDISKQNKKLLNKILLRIILGCTIYTLIGIILFTIGLEIYRSFIFYWTSPIYRFAQIVEYYLPLLILLYLIFGYIPIICHYLKKPFLYLDEIMGAVKTAYSGDNTITELSEPMSQYALELNQLKMNIQLNEKAAKDAEQRKNDLIVYLAHDLKTPLTSVIGYLTLLKDEQEISLELRQKYLSISLDKAERLEDLINEFFEITRFNLTTLSLENSHINLTRMLEQITYEFKPMLDEKNLICDLITEPDIMIICDIDKMQRVFDNLLRNAINYSFYNSTITIMVTKNEQDIVVTFENNGNTIPEEKLSRIFEQFYRLDASRTTKSGGAGLGLAIAKEIIELHGGAIAASSADEKISFEVILPIFYHDSVSKGRLKK